MDSKQMRSCYAVSSQAYLARAKARLGEESPASLFYAALELRCGVEQRLREHLEHQDHVSEKLKSGWKIAKLGRTVESAFRLGDRIAEMTFMRKGEVIFRLYYTPVTSELQTEAGRLGNYLHAPLIYREPDDPLWVEMEDLLKRVYLGLARANVGTLYGPPLRERSTGLVSVPMVLDETAGILLDLGVGADYVLRFEYLDALPPELEPTI